METDFRIDTDDGRPVLRFRSGATQYIESVEHGRLLSQGWSCDGQPTAPTPADVMRDQPADAFQLIVDGQDLRRTWRFDGFQQIEEGHGVLRLRSSRLSIEIAAHTRTDGTGFLVRWLDIRNTGTTPLSITSIACWSGLLARGLDEPDLAEAQSQFEVGRFLYRAHNKVGRFAWEPLPFGTLRLDGNRGCSGFGPPFFMLRRRGTAETFVGLLGWSRNWSMEFTYDPFSAFSSLAFNSGPAGYPPLRVVNPGETVTSPSLHLGFLRGTDDDCVQALHRHLRASVLPPRADRPFPPISYNHWGTMKTDMNEERLLSEIEKAAAVGAEIFIIDAGWYGAVLNNYAANCGDWTPGPWLPNGFKRIAERIHARGMRFGLWFAPEMIGSRSRLLAEHPDWAVKIEERGYFSNIKEEAHPGFFMNVDFAEPHIERWVADEMERIVASYGVDLLRIDGGLVSYEGAYRQTGAFVENSLWRQCEAIYRILDRVRARHPELIIDNANGGGGTQDAGMLARSEIAWVCDDYHTSTLMIQSLNGVTMALPPEICTRTFGTIVHTFPDLAYALRAPLFGQYCISGMKPEWLAPGRPEHALVKRHLALYRDFIRPFLATCRVFHHTPVLVGSKRPPCCVLEYAAADASRALIGVFRLQTNAAEPVRIVPRGLDPERRYDVHFENSDRSFVMLGSALATDGISVDLNADNASELVLIREIM